MGYSKYESVVDPTDIVRFGKRVNYENKLTSDAVMEEHLNQMRDKMSQQKAQHAQKKRQEMEFLEHIRKLDELEHSRQAASKKAINSDFVYYNGQIQAENQDKKNFVEATRRADKYNYFPFVSGELIEKHRATLGAQLKNDLQSYLDYSKNSQVRNNSSAVGSFNDAGSNKSFLRTGPPSHYSQNRARAVKELFDSDYVKPVDNFRVFQDSNPLKVAAHKEALERFEGKLKKESQLAGHHLSDHQRRINFDQNEKDREVDEKVNKQ